MIARRESWRVLKSRRGCLRMGSTSTRTCSRCGTKPCRRYLSARPADSSPFSLRRYPSARCVHSTPSTIPQTNQWARRRSNRAWPLGWPACSRACGCIQAWIARCCRTTTSRGRPHNGVSRTIYHAGYSAPRRSLVRSTFKARSSRTGFVSCSASVSRVQASLKSHVNMPAQLPRRPFTPENSALTSDMFSRLRNSHLERLVSTQVPISLTVGGRAGPPARAARPHRAVTRRAARGARAAPVDAIASGGAVESRRGRRPDWS